MIIGHETTAVLDMVLWYVERKTQQKFGFLFPRSGLSSSRKFFGPSVRTNDQTYSFAITMPSNYITKTSAHGQKGLAQTASAFLICSEAFLQGHSNNYTVKVWLIFLRRPFISSTTVLIQEHLRLQMCSGRCLLQKEHGECSCIGGSATSAYSQGLQTGPAWHSYHSCQYSTQMNGPDS